MLSALILKYWYRIDCELFAYHMNCCNSYAVSKAARAAKYVNE